MHITYRSGSNLVHSYFKGNLWHVGCMLIQPAGRLGWRASQKHLWQNGREQRWSADSGRISQGLPPRWRALQDACPIMSENQNSQIPQDILIIYMSSLFIILILRIWDSVVAKTFQTVAYSLCPVGSGMTRKNTVCHSWEKREVLL